MGFSNSFMLGKYKKKTLIKEAKYGDEALSTFNGYIKENYYMLGNAVCPPVIAILAGAILNCIPSVVGGNWVEQGLLAGIKLSLEALSPNGIEEVRDRILG